MRTRTSRFLALAAFALPLALGLAAPAQAQAQSGVVKLVVPVPPGSSGDTYARFFAAKLAPMIGQAVIVDNRPGANTWIAVNTVLNAPADGTSILLISAGSMSILPLQSPNLAYQPLRDIRPLMIYNRGDAVLVTGKDSKLKNVQDLLAAARNGSASQRVTLGNYGLVYRLGAAEFEKRANIKFSHVNYKGAPQATTDVVGNQIDAALMDLGGALELIRAGKLVPLATTGPKRSVDLPDVPTLAETGLPGLAIHTWTGWGVRAGTPQPLAAKLEAALLSIASTPEFKAFNAKSGNAEITNFDHKQSIVHVKSETERFRELMPTIEPMVN